MLPGLRSLPRGTFITQVRRGPTIIEYIRPAVPARATLIGHVLPAIGVNRAATRLTCTFMLGTLTSSRTWILASGAVHETLSSIDDAFRGALDRIGHLAPAAADAATNAANGSIHSCEGGTPQTMPSAVHKLDAIALWQPPLPCACSGADANDYPRLTLFLPAVRRSRGAIIVCPGGAYAHRAAHEGVPVWRNGFPAWESRRSCWITASRRITTPSPFATFSGPFAWCGPMPQRGEWTRPTWV